MTRALLVTPDYPPATGGIQRLLHAVVGHAQALEWDVLTIAPSAADAREPRVTRVCREGVPHRLGIAMLTAAAGARGVSRRYDVVVCGHVVASLAAALAAGPSRAPVAQWLYADEAIARPAMTRWALGHARAVLTLGDYGASLAARFGAADEVVHRIAPGVSLAEAPGVAGGRRPTVITVARIDERYKGHDVMVTAIALVRAQLPGIRWVVVGDGVLRPWVESLVAAAGQEDVVEFTGQVSSEMREALLREAQVYAMPSRVVPGYAGEGYGIVYLEAGAAGLPVVGGCEGGAIDAVVDGTTGILVDATDSVAIAGALVALLSDPTMARRMGAAGRERASTLTWERTAAHAEEVLLELCASS